MNSQITPGQMLHGACMGIFGTHHYGCVKVEAVGKDWIVGRAINNDWYGQPMGLFDAVFAHGDHVLVDAAMNRDGGLQDGCKSSFAHGCAYRYDHDPEF